MGMIETDKMKIQFGIELPYNREAGNLVKGQSTRYQNYSRLGVNRFGPFVFLE